MLRYARLRYVVFGLLLCSVSAISFARDVRMHGANGDGGSDACNAEPAPASSAGKRAAPVVRGNKIKAPATPHGGSGSGNDIDAGRAPRWHSFLPGMFR